MYRTSASHEGMTMVVVEIVRGKESEGTPWGEGTLITDIPYTHEETLEWRDRYASITFNTKGTITRDYLGRSPLFYGGSDTRLVISSAPKRGPFILHSFPPGTTMTIDRRGALTIQSTGPSFKTLKAAHPPTVETLANALVKSVREECETKVGILFSGGLDSTTIATIARDNAHEEPILFTVGFSGSEDVSWSDKVAHTLGLPLVVHVIDEEELVRAVTEVSSLFPYPLSLLDEEIGAFTLIACREVRERGLKYVLTGQGSEELFAGYERHAHYSSSLLSFLLYEELRWLHVRDLDRNNVIAAAHHVTLRMPFLSDELISLALALPPDLQRKSELKKGVLRDVARRIGVPPSVCERKKRALQYGSGIHKILMKHRKNR